MQKSLKKITRLIEVYNETLGYSIVRRAEEAKIALSDSPEYIANIALLSETLELTIERSDGWIYWITKKQNDWIN